MADTFNSTEQFGAPQYNFSDGSDNYANKGFIITIQHVPSGNKISFKAFINAYTETFSPDWVSEVVYGRADPIYQYKNTIRNLTLGLKIPAAAEAEAFQNLAKVQRLTQFLYPNYTEVGSATTVAQSPLLRLSVMNLAKNQKEWSPKLQQYTKNTEGRWELSSSVGALRSAAPPGTHGMVYESIDGGTDSGLLGAMKSLTINHNLDTEAGVIEVHSPVAAGDVISNAGILPKLIEINFDFGVIHEHHLGWDDTGNFSNPAFPYGLDMYDIPNLDEDI
jgi:hypothetical protein